MNKAAKRGFIAAIACFTLLGPAQAADLLILASNQSGLPEGGIIDHSAALNLPEGAKLTLLSTSGKKIEISGPYAGAAEAGNGAGGDEAANRGMLAAVSRLIVGKSTDDRQVGVTRNVPSAVGQGSTEDPWALNVSISGSHCVMAEGSTLLWRPKAETTENVSITRMKPKARAKTQWPAGAASLEWPATLELTDKATYLVRVGKGMLVNKFKIHVLPSDLASDFHRVAWMSERGCKRQARKLLASLK